MAPIAASLARSESKAKFLIRIGLEENNRIHRQLYATMKAEAVQGWLRMTSSRDALLPTLRDDPAIEPPYTYAQINESAMRAEVVHIFDHASAETRILYNLANDVSIAVEDNWIIRWLLWHVFRYRDDRNCSVNRGTRPSHSLESPGSVKQKPNPTLHRPPRPLPPMQRAADSVPVSHPARAAASQVGYYDPVRGTYHTRR